MMNNAEVFGARVSSEIGRLSPVDMADALELSHLAGWNQTEEDWHRILRLSAEGCFCIREEGRVVATTTLVTYDSDCAWVGMVLTHPNWRERGFARRLVGHSLAIARELGIASIKLDATDQGRSSYESLGFAVEQDVERWERAGISTPRRTTQNYSLPLDHMAYGYSRAELLESLGAGAHGTDGVDGYVLTRPGKIYPYVGPCIARDAEAAKRLLPPVLDAVSGSGWFWDLLSANHNATALAATLGFKPVRRLVRMSVGRSLREHEQNIYALAGLEFG